MPKEKVEYTGSVSPQEAAQYLESLARGLREGSMLLESGDASLTIEVADNIKISVEASGEAEKGKASVDVSMSWRKAEAEAQVPPPGLLIIAGATPAEVASGLTE